MVWSITVSTFEMTALRDGGFDSGANKFPKDLDFTPDEEVWNYTEALRQIVLAKGFSRNIKFIRIMDLLGLHSTKAITKEEYLALISECRKQLMVQFGDPSFDFRLEISRNQDACMTYSGYKHFLEKDLLYTDYALNASSKTAYRKICKKVAADMITRGKVSVSI
jgi:pyoverdine/dityrosine biosynthesis protein Dit1